MRKRTLKACLLLLPVLLFAFGCKKERPPFGALPSPVCAIVYTEKGASVTGNPPRTFLVKENQILPYTPHERSFSRTFPLERLEALIQNNPQYDFEPFGQPVHYTNLELGEIFLFDTSAQDNSAYTIFVDNALFKIPKINGFEYFNWQVTSEDIILFQSGNGQFYLSILALTSKHVTNLSAPIIGILCDEQVFLQNGKLYYFSQGADETFSLIEYEIDSKSVKARKILHDPLSFFVCEDHGIMVLSYQGSKIAIETCGLSEDELKTADVIAFSKETELGYTPRMRPTFLYNQMLCGVVRGMDGISLYAFDLGRSELVFQHDLDEAKRSGAVADFKFAVEQDGEYYDLQPHQCLRYHG